MIADDDNYRLFAGNLEWAIKAYGPEDENETDDDLLRKQAEQFTRLISLERQFRAALIRCRWGPQIYRAFIAKICDDKDIGGNGNILTSRPFFRERQEVCIGPISQALKNRHVQSLYQYHFNYQFVSFVMSIRPWTLTSKLSILSREISRLRTEILSLNMPLVISQARKFWHKAPLKTQDTRFTIMDFIQIGADGLMSAVDKFCIPFGVEENYALIRVWRAVAIGRMKGNFIDMFSETTVHFFPTDKRKLYRANKHLKDFQGPIDFEKLAQLVNDDFKALGSDLRTTGEELAQLMGAAANAASVDTQEDPESQDTLLERAAATADWRPDVRAESNETMRNLKHSINGLSVLEQKLIRLKGVDLNSI